MKRLLICLVALLLAGCGATNTPAVLTLPAPADFGNDALLRF